MAENNLSELNELMAKIDINKHFPKISDEQVKWFAYGLGKGFGRMEDDTEIKELIECVMLSGSFMEGAPFARLLNPNLKKEYIEFEFDMMFPMGRVLQGYENAIIQNLDYAKGFAWLRYESEGMQFEPTNGKKVNEFLHQHVDGNYYLNSQAFKEDSNLTEFPDMRNFSKFQEEIQGPSNNVDATVLIKQMVLQFKSTKKADLQRGVQVLSGILGVIKRADVQLQKYHQDIVNQFTEFKINSEKQFNKSKMTVSEPRQNEAESLPKDDRKSDEIMTDLDVEEFLCNVLPRSRENINQLIHLHWALIGFVNEIICCIRFIQTTLIENNLEKLLGFWSYAFMPLLNHGISLEPKMVEYILHLFSLPKKFSECCDTGDKQNFVDTFLKDTIESLPIEIAKVLKLYRRCMMVLGPRFVILQAICYDTKDDNIDTNVPDVEEFSLNIDRVPAISVAELPSFSHNFKDRDRSWPSPEIMDKIFNAGFHLVPKPSVSVRRNENLDWRWSFSNAEMILANTRNDKMDMSYLFLKSFLYVYFKAFEWDDKTLPSYFAKTTMMWVCEQHSEKWWHQNPLYVCVVELLNQMAYFFYDEFLPHYFIEGLNLFDGVPKELIHFGQAVFLSICQDPWICVLEIANKLAEMKISKKDKNSSDKPVDDPLQKVFGREGTEENLKQQGTNMPLTIAEFRKAIDERMKSFKDIPEKQGLLRLTQEIYKSISELCPQDFQESLLLDPDYVTDMKDITFAMLMNDAESELTQTCVYRFSFRGSTGLNLDLNIRR